MQGLRNFSNCKERTGRCVGRLFSFESPFSAEDGSHGALLRPMRFTTTRGRAWSPWSCESGPPQGLGLRDSGGSRRLIIYVSSVDSCGDHKSVTTQNLTWESLKSWNWRNTDTDTQEHQDNSGKQLKSAFWPLRFVPFGLAQMDPYLASPAHTCLWAEPAAHKTRDVSAGGEETQGSDDKYLRQRKAVICNRSPGYFLTLPKAVRRQPRVISVSTLTHGGQRSPHGHG